MCGRYKQVGQLQALKDMLGISSDINPAGMVSPGMRAPVIHKNAQGDNVASLMTWGFIPHWSKETSGSKLINARAETLAEKPAFRDAYAARRCLIPAEAFYEWDINTTPRRAFEISPANDVSMAFAGIWDRWVDPSNGLHMDTFAVITRAAEAPVSKVHDRMPVALSGAAAFERWLDVRHPLDSAPMVGFDMQPFIFPTSRREKAADPRQIALF